MSGEPCAAIGGDWNLLIPLVLMPVLLAFCINAFSSDPPTCQDRIITEGRCSDYPGSRGSELVVDRGVATCRCKK